MMYTMTPEETKQWDRNASQRAKVLNKVRAKAPKGAVVELYADDGSTCVEVVSL